MEELICIRTEKEIEDKIRELTEDSDNFTSDNFGSEAADNGVYELSYSSFASEKTLSNFYKWLFVKEIK